MENQTKSLADFYQAVILLANHYRLDRVERGQGKFCTFVFSDPEGTAQDTIDQHWRRELMVVSRDLIDAIVELKTKIYDRGQV